MSFATLPGPSGYAAPPRRNANPLLIVLGVCGGCALIVIIGLVIVTVIGARQPFTQRIFATTKFMAGIKGHDYNMAAAQLTGDALAEYPASKLQQTEDAFEQKYGSLQTFVQSDMDLADQKNPNSWRQISYKLHYQNGIATIVLRFDQTAQTNKIAGLEWTGDEQRSGGETGQRTPNKKRSSPGGE